MAFEAPVTIFDLLEPTPLPDGFEFWINGITPSDYSTDPPPIVYVDGEGGDSIYIRNPDNEEQRVFPEGARVNIDIEFEFTGEDSLDSNCRFQIYGFGDDEGGDGLVSSSGSLNIVDFIVPEGGTVLQMLLKANGADAINFGATITSLIIIEEALIEEEEETEPEEEIDTKPCGTFYKITLVNETLGTLILNGDPVGWEEQEEILKRGDKHGIFWDYTLKLEFYCGNGKEYLDAAFDNEDIDAEVSIVIEKACNCNDFNERFRGKVNFKNYERQDNFTKVNIEQDGIAKLLMNRMDTKVNLSSEESIDGTPLDTLDFSGYDLTLHSKAIVYNSTLEFNPDRDSSENDDTGSNNYIYPPIIVVKDEIDGMSSFPVQFELGVGAPHTAQYFFVSQLAGTYNITYRFKGVISEEYSSSRGFDINFGYDTGDVTTPYTALTSTTSYFETGGIISHAFDISGTLSVVLAIGDKFTFFHRIFNSTPNRVSTISFDYEIADISFEIESTVAETTCKAFPVFEAGAAIFQRITGQVDSFRSEYFGRRNSEPFSYDSNGCGSFRAITNGGLIRGFPLEDNNDSGGNLVTAGKPLFLSGNDYFDGLNAIDNLGLGVEQIENNQYAVVIEKKSYFYDSEVIIRLTNVPNIKYSVAPGYYFNKVTVGYQKWENEEVNGLDEFNTKREYTLPIKNTDNQLTILSKFIASGCAIEFTRRKQFTDNPTLDYKYDNDNFIICLNKDTNGAGDPSLLIAEKDENFLDTINNLFSPETSYNLRISPARNLLRWQSFLNTGLLKKPGEAYKFSYGEGNYKMESQFISDSCPGDYNDQLLSESQDIVWDSIGDTYDPNTQPIWIPMFAEYEFPVTDEEWDVIRANPKGTIEFSGSDTDYLKSYIIEIKRKQSGLASFKLILANDEATADCVSIILEAGIVECGIVE